MALDNTCFIPGGKTTGFMAPQGGHTKLLTGNNWKNGPFCVTGQTQRKNISKIAGPNTKAPVRHCLQCGSGAEPEQGL